MSRVMRKPIYKYANIKKMLVSLLSAHSDQPLRDLASISETSSLLLTGPLKLSRRVYV